MNKEKAYAVFGLGRYGLAVAEELLAGEAEQARLAALLSKKPRPASEGERAKLVASLLRYGYELALIEKMI